MTWEEPHTERDYLGKWTFSYSSYSVDEKFCSFRCKNDEPSGPSGLSLSHNAKAWKFKRYILKRRTTLWNVNFFRSRVLCVKKLKPQKDRVVLESNMTKSQANRQFSPGHAHFSLVSLSWFLVAKGKTWESWDRKLSFTFLYFFQSSVKMPPLYYEASQRVI